MAAEDGRFAEEIVPVTVKGRKSETVVDRDEHIRLACAGIGKHIGKSPMANNSAYIKLFGDGLNELDGLVDNRHVGPLRREARRDAKANPARTTNDDLHGSSLSDRLPSRVRELNRFAQAVNSGPRADVTPNDLSLRCKADRSMPIKAAVREILPPKRLI